MPYKAIVVKVGDLKPRDMCSIDPWLGFVECSAIAAAHNNGSLDAQENCWFGVIGDYYGAPKDHYAIKLVEVDALEPELLESEKTVFAAAYAAALASGTKEESLDAIAWATVMKMRKM